MCTIFGEAIFIFKILIQIPSDVFIRLVLLWPLQFCNKTRFGSYKLAMRCTHCYCVFENKYYSKNSAKIISLGIILK